MAKNNEDSEVKGFICAFLLEEVGFEFGSGDLENKYDGHLFENENWEGDKHWIVRLKLDESQENLEIYNKDTESINFVNELPMYLLEYDHNKLFVACLPTHMFLVINW